MKIQLKPCPACNSKSEYVEDLHEEGILAIQCQNPICGMTIIKDNCVDYEDQLKLGDVWNCFPRGETKHEDTPKSLST
jgi:hypothetical protein